MATPTKSDCIFCRIASGEMGTEMIAESEMNVAFRDLSPQAPVHVLIVPRKPIPTLDALTEDDESLVGHLFLIALKVAAEEGLADGYRTVFNNGPDAQQTVYHIHLHLIGGRKMSWPPG